MGEISMVNNRFLQVGDVVCSIDDFAGAKFVKKTYEDDNIITYCIFVKLKSYNNWVCAMEFKTYVTARKKYNELIHELSKY